MCKIFNILLLVSCILNSVFIEFSICADCEIYGLALKKGESKTVPGKCSLITCNGKASDEHTIQACPNAYAPPNCKFVPVNLNKSYPECCPHWSC